MGKEDLWQIKRHPINTELGYTQVDEVHSFKYEHERTCGDVFVRLALQGIGDWKLHTKIHKGIIPDRTTRLEDGIWHIEVEMGTADRVTEKVERYSQYYRETHEPFKVLFLVGQMRDWQLPSHYHVESLEILTPIRTPIQTTNDNTQQKPEEF